MSEKLLTRMAEVLESINTNLDSINSNLSDISESLDRMDESLDGLIAVNGNNRFLCVTGNVMVN